MLAWSEQSSKRNDVTVVWVFLLLYSHATLLTLRPVLEDASLVPSHSLYIGKASISFPIFFFKQSYFTY